MRYINRRESPRMEVKLRCRLFSSMTWPRATSGETENISRNGLLLSCDPTAAAVAIKMGDLATVEIELPANHGFAPKCIHCQGTVVRVFLTPEGHQKLALSINYMQ